MLVVGRVFKNETPLYNQYHCIRYQYSVVVTTLASHARGRGFDSHLHPPFSLSGLGGDRRTEGRTEGRKSRHHYISRHSSLRSLGGYNEVALQQAKMRMVRWMCGIKQKDTVTSKGLIERLGLDDIISVLQQNRLR